MNKLYYGDCLMIMQEMKQDAPCWVKTRLSVIFGGWTKSASG
ncbi:MAG: hypothetical protein M2R45_01240 [Verrucomicrobia subdivision 3 bacterium]|nr:hypothetical protein [Limisphaerales bacterium]MCS1415111.1 hypothetical protein [Limisphaerales bacterium]